MTSPPNPPPKGREALEEIERRFSQLLGRLGQTFEEALSTLPEGTAQSRTRSFVGTVDEFLAARRQAAQSPQDSDPTDGDPVPPAGTAPEAASEVPRNDTPHGGGGKLTLAFGDTPPVEIDLPDTRIGAAWRISVAGGTLRFDPD